MFDENIYSKIASYFGRDVDSLFKVCKVSLSAQQNHESFIEWACNNNINTHDLYKSKHFRTSNICRLDAILRIKCEDYTSLIEAAARHGDLDVVKYILHKESHKSNYGRYVMLLSCAMYESLSSGRSNIPLLKMLIECGLQYDIIFKTAIIKNVSEARDFILHEYNPSNVDEMIDFSINTQRYDTVAALLRYDPSGINFKLHHAIEKHDVRMVTILLDIGANVHDFKAADMIVSLSNIQMMDLFIDKGASLGRFIFLALEADNTNIIMTLLSRSTIDDICNHAVNNESYKFVEMMLEMGANVDKTILACVICNRVEFCRKICSQYTYDKAHLRWVLSNFATEEMLHLFQDS